MAGRLPPQCAWLHAHLLELWQQPTPYGNATAPLRALAAAGVSVSVVLANAVVSILPTTPSTDDMVDIAVFCVLVLLVVRLVVSFHRWRLASQHFTVLLESARSIVTIGCSLLSPPSVTHEVSSHVRFLGDLKRFVLSYVVLVLQDYSEHDDAATAYLADLLDDDELSILREAPKSNTRAAVVELWIRRIVGRAFFPLESEPQHVRHEAPWVELSREVSSLCGFYSDLRVMAANPPLWTLTQYSSHAELSFLAFYAFARVASLHWRVVVWVFLWGLVLFGLDQLASSIECGSHQEEERLENLLFELQDEINACVGEQLRSIGVLDQPSRDMKRTPRPSLPPRASSWFGPLPSSSSHRSSPPHSPRRDGPRKPSLKQILDMATTSAPLPSALIRGETQLEGVHARDDERRPLLSTTPGRYNLFLEPVHSIEEGENEATDVEEDLEDDEAALRHSPV